MRQDGWGSGQILTIVQLMGVRLTIVIMLTVGIMSPFMNNIGSAVISVANERQIPPSKLLIPLAFASLLGGNMTLIGTPPNILATGIMTQYPGLEPFGLIAFFAFWDHCPDSRYCLYGSGAVAYLAVGVPCQRPRAGFPAAPISD